MSTVLAKPQLALSTGGILALLCIAQFLDGMDISSTAVVLPAIQHALGMDAQSLQWIVSGYVLGYGGFLLLGGRVADLFGRRRVFLLSMLLFALASLVAGLTSEPWLLIAARIIKGICAGFTGPAALSLLLGLHQEPAKRTHALGVFSSTGAAGFALGMVIGGLVGNLSWRYTMLLPAPIALVVVAIGALALERDKPSQKSKRFDLPGSVMGTVALLLIVFGAAQAASYGWISMAALGPLGAGLALLGLFLHHEHTRAAAPLLPLAIFRRPGLSYASLLAFLMQGNYVAFQFVAVLYLQNVLGWSPFQSALSFAFGGSIVALSATKFAKLSFRIGTIPLIIAGLLLQTLGFAWFILLDSVPNLVLVAILQLFIGLGFAMAFPSINIKGLAQTRESEHGLASGIVLSAFQIGSGIILAVVASLFASSTAIGLGRYRFALLLVLALATFSVIVAVTGGRREYKAATAPANSEL
ncbi:MAG TPA: MFS transporter [Candidatus Saccharimonadia bacterium]|nr:MFS transporter [Candidatus Saccharimonadia bacterium]